MQISAVNASVLAASFVLSALGTWAMRAYALKVSLLDQPNERSLHSTPVPRGGGVAITVSVLATCLFSSFANSRIETFHIVLMILAGAMSALGFFDDRHTLSAKFRLIIQITLCSLAVASFFIFADGRFDLFSPVIAGVILILFFGWMTNLYNFMDGSDGIAGVQGLTVSLGLAVLGEQSFIVVPALALAGACAGFLIFNWQPAKIFMGDVGSVFLGFTSALLVALSSLVGGPSFLAVLVLHGAFVVDASTTLVTRLLRGKKPHVAHKSHVYQQWVQRGKSHRFVALAYAATNCFWLLPMAFIVNQQSSMFLQIVFVGIAWLPLLVIAISSKAGIDS